MTDQLRLTLIGCGNMGSTLLAGWLGLEQVGRITIVDPDPELPDGAAQDSRIITCSDASELGEQGDSACDICVLAVKPQIMDDVLQSLQDAGLQADMLVSVAAGITIDAIRNSISMTPAIVRVMPNTPSIIAQGVLAVCPGDSLTPRQEAHIKALMEVCGVVVWLDDESLMNAVTAVSGSGPAYVFAMIEALAEAGRAQGLPDDLAAQLARRTVEGAAGLSADHSDIDISQLRANVTSPGGTTEAGLRTLLDSTQGLKPLLNRTVEAAKKRGDELSG